MPTANHQSRKPKIAIYRRVSTARQAEEGISLDVQLQACLDEADRMYGRGLYDYRDFCDDGYSGSLGLRSQDARKTAHRPALSDMMQAVAEGEIDAVFVYRLDRLFRSVPLAAHLLNDYFHKYQVGLVSVQERIDTTAAAGRALLYVMAVMAQFFLDIMSENIAAALRRVRSQGRFLGVTPYGWRRPTEEEKQRGVTASLVRNDEQGRWVVQMKDWYLAGWGIRRIAQALHDAGVPSPEGQEWWTFGSIRDTILNPVHAGLNRVGDGKLVPGDWWDQR
ncbi:MAG: recombinase family protein, partial [Armatimonadetes bacterium]|nr:recombinase family protein [Armatimonadota bacterium]